MAANDIAARVAALKGDGVAVNELWLLRELVARVAVAVNLPLQEAGGLVLDVLAEQSDELLLYERRPGEGFFHLLGLQRAVMPEEQRMPWHDSTASLPSERDVALQGLKLWWLYGREEHSEVAGRFDRLAVLPKQAAACFGLHIPSGVGRLPVECDSGQQVGRTETMPNACVLLKDPVLRDFPRARSVRADADFCALVAGLYGALKAANVVGPFEQLAKLFDRSETHIKNCVREHERRGQSADCRATPAVDLEGAMRSFVREGRDS